MSVSGYPGNPNVPDLSIVCIYVCVCVCGVGSSVYGGGGWIGGE